MIGVRQGKEYQVDVLDFRMSPLGQVSRKFVAENGYVKGRPNVDSAGFSLLG